MRVGYIFFLSLEGARRHLRSLQGMKERFIQQEKQLKSICLNYLHEGEWLEPKQKEDRTLGRS